MTVFSNSDSYQKDVSGVLGVKLNKEIKKLSCYLHLPLQRHSPPNFVKDLV